MADAVDSVPWIATLVTSGEQFPVRIQIPDFRRAILAPRHNPRSLGIGRKVDGSKPFPPGVLDEDAAHRFGRGSEEMSTAVPLLSFLNIHQPEVGVVHQRRRLSGYASTTVLAGAAGTDRLVKAFEEIPAKLTS